MVWRRLSVYGAIVAGTLVSAEGLARIYDWTPSASELQVGDRLGVARYEHAYGGLGDLVARQDGHWNTWFHRPYHVQTNSVGLRHSEEPSERAFRILAVGDSQTFGPYLANEDTWPAWTENALRVKLATSDGVQVFNAGIAGYTILDELSYLEQKGLGLRPRLVILAAFENDLADLAKERNGLVTRPRSDKASPGLSAWVRRLAQASAFVNLIEKMRRSIAFARHGVDVRRGEANPVAAAVEGGPAKADRSALRRRYDALFDATAKLLEANDIRLAALFIPSPETAEGAALSEMAPVLRQAAVRNAIPYLDLTEEFRRIPDAGPRLYLLQREPRTGKLVGNGHLSREGNATVGKAVADWVGPFVELTPR